MTGVQTCALPIYDETVDEYVIPFTKLVVKDKGDDEESYGDDKNIKLFILEVNNQELTEPLYKIMKLLGTDSGRTSDIVDDINQELIDLLIEGGIGVPALFGELLITPLLRKETEELERPNWNSYHGSSDYNVLTYKQALTKNPSIIVSISSERLKSQLVKADTFKKSATSFLDPSFRV